MLAPLIARMVTSNINQRFTASEALGFARTIPPSVHPLDRIERHLEMPPAYFAIDLWEDLPEEFLRKWGSHREDAFSWTMRLQNWLFLEKVEWGWYLMYYSRYTVRVLTFVPRFISRHLISIATLLVKHSSLRYVQ